MKKQILLWGALLCSGIIVHAQDLRKAEVPSLILNEFNGQFPKAKQVEWEFERGYYQVEFKGTNDLEHIVSFNELAQVIEEKEEIKIFELPHEIREKIKQEFKSYNIDKVEKITDERGITRYMIELDSLFQGDLKILMNEKGQVLQKILD